MILWIDSLAGEIGPRSIPDFGPFLGISFVEEAFFGKRSRKRVVDYMADFFALRVII